MTIDIIEKMIRLWDPYELYVFPKDEYNSYAKKIYTFVNGTEDLTLEILTNFVYELFREGMKVIKSENSYIELNKLDKASSERFSDLYLSIDNNYK